MRALLLGAALSLMTTTSATASQAVAPDLDAFVEQVRSTFEVPGIAVAIVKDGQVVLARGYGLADVENNTPVTPQTLFAIASNTKAFTAASLSILADEGKLSLDDRVIDHLPWFQMSDPYVTREMRVRDLLAHRSGLGLGAGDLLYWPTTGYSLREVVQRLRHVPLQGGFRGQYAYDNILYGVAQLVIEDVSGQSYADFLQQRIFDPLGMASTRYNHDHLRPGDAAATGYSKADFSRLVPAPPLTWRNLSGAGGLYSNLDDLTRWVRVQLGGGVISGEGKDAVRLFSAKRQQAMWSVVTPIDLPPLPADPEQAKAAARFNGYGEGWRINDFRGRKLVWHAGGWPGMVTRITLVPEQRLGIIVLTNQEVPEAFNAITSRVLDDALGETGVDWLKVYAGARGDAQQQADASWKTHVAARNGKSKPSLPLSAYAGTYRDPWYGDVSVTLEKGVPVLAFSQTAELIGELEHWQNDSFIVRWRERWLNADAFVNFRLDADGRVEGIGMQAISPLTDFSFDFHDLRLQRVEAAAAKP